MVATFFVTDWIDRARYGKVVTVAPSKSCKNQLQFGKWYYGSRSLGTDMGEFQIGVYVDHGYVVPYKNGNTYKGQMYICEDHAHSSIQPVAPVACAVDYEYVEGVCTILFNVSDCMENVAKDKTDLHLDTGLYNGDNDHIILNFKGNFGDGAYELAVDSPAGDLTKCSIPSPGTPTAAPTTVQPTPAPTTPKPTPQPTPTPTQACPPLPQNTWLYGKRDMQGLGSYEVGAKIVGSTIYICEAHTGSTYKPVPPTTCSNTLTVTPSCDLDITVSKCLDDLAVQQTDLHLAGAVYTASNKTLSLNFTSHFEGANGLIALSADTKPDELTKCQASTDLLSEVAEEVVEEVAACTAPPENVWFYGNKTLGKLSVLGRYEVGVKIVGSTMYVCEAHTGSFQKVPPTTCANTFSLDQSTCALTITVSKCLDDLATKKTDLHLTPAGTYFPDNQTMGLTFTSHFGGGAYYLNQGFDPDVSAACQSSVDALAKVEEPVAACSAPPENVWFYGNQSLGIPGFGLYEVGAMISGTTIYICEAHTGQEQPVPATTCANSFTFDASTCSLSITESKCLDDLATQKTDLHLTTGNTYFADNATINLQFTSHGPGGGSYYLNQGYAPDALTACKASVDPVSLLMM